MVFNFRSSLFFLCLLLCCWLPDPVLASDSDRGGGDAGNVNVTSAASMTPKWERKFAKNFLAWLNLSIGPFLFGSFVLNCLPESLDKEMLRCYMRSLGWMDIVIGVIVIIAAELKANPGTNPEAEVVTMYSNPFVIGGVLQILSGLWRCVCSLACAESRAMMWFWLFLFALSLLSPASFLLGIPNAVIFGNELKRKNKETGNRPMVV